eukprot:m.2006 g.2006  ORF g.2006 m.2006 type:complete len:268 (-) comp1692_c0_seq1:64-867(-)
MNIPDTIAFAMTSPSDDDHLICEGYLKKIRGFAQNRRRWFRLTQKYFAYFQEDGGRFIAFIERSNIVDVESVSPLKFVLRTSTPFGASEQHEMVLEGKTEEVTERWISAIKNDEREGDPGRLYVEGYISKVQPFGSFNRLRWFTLTEQYFSYHTIEGGEVMGTCPVSSIKDVISKGTYSFVLAAESPFTRTGSAVVTCKCENEHVRDKWLNCFTAILGSSKARPHKYRPLNNSSRAFTDTFAIAGTKTYEYKGTNSEGNRFIHDQEL